MKTIIYQLILTLLATSSANALNPRSWEKNTKLNESHQSLAQKRSITIGILSTHFFYKNDNSGIESNIESMNPGAEALFHYSLNNITSLATGLSYQHNNIIHGESSLGLKTRINEVAIPLLLSIKLFQSSVPDMELAGGFYFGQYVSIKNSHHFFENDKKNYANLFSMDDFIGDTYVAIGKQSIIKKIPIGLDLFFRYRLKEHQLINRNIARAFYGIKFTYGFNLK